MTSLGTEIHGISRAETFSSHVWQPLSSNLNKEANSFARSTEFNSRKLIEKEDYECCKYACVFSYLIALGELQCPDGTNPVNLKPYHVSGQSVPQSTCRTGHFIIPFGENLFLEKSTKNQPVFCQERSQTSLPKCWQKESQNCYVNCYVSHFASSLHGYASVTSAFGVRYCIFSRSMCLDGCSSDKALTCFDLSAAGPGSFQETPSYRYIEWWQVAGPDPAATFFRFDSGVMQT